MTAAEYPAASWQPVPGFGFPQGAHGGNKPRYVVVHATGGGDGTAAGQVSWFRANPAHGVHFVVGRAGEVMQLVLMADSAYGNGIIQSPHDPWWVGQPNDYTVSIEHCNNAANSDPLTPAQQVSSFALIAWLCKWLNIPARAADATGGVAGHYQIEGVNKAHCPGNYPWAALWSYLKGQAMDSNFSLTAPNNLHCAKTGFDYHGLIAQNILSKVNPDSISAIVGLPEEANHLDPDGYWRQKTSIGVVVQAGNNAADFHIEAPVTTADPLVAQAKAWVATMPAGLK